MDKSNAQHLQGKSHPIPPPQNKHHLLCMMLTKKTVMNLSLHHADEQMHSHI